MRIRIVTEGASLRLNKPYARWFNVIAVPF